MKNYSSNVCDKTINPKTKKNHLKSLRDIELGNCIQMKHNIENPDSSDIDEIFNEHQ